MQYDLNGILVNTYKNSREAAEAIGCTINPIRIALKKHSLSNNYQWRYEGDEPPQKMRTHKTPIVQIDINSNKIISKYESIAEAARSVNKEKSTSTIGDCCRGKRKIAYGYKWEYYDPEKHDISHLEVK